MELPAPLEALSLLGETLPAGLPPGDSAEAVLEALDPEQRAVASNLHGPMCVLAGAGTGKTRAITHRIAYGVRCGVMAPAHVLAVTFTTRAAGEMRGRLRQLGAAGVQARTFHAAALRQLRYFWPKVVGGDPLTLVGSKAPLVAEAAFRCRLRAERTEIRDLAAEVEWAKVTQVVADDYVAAAAKAGRAPSQDPVEVARVYAAYEQAKRDRGCMDFEDVLLLTVGILEDRPDVAETVRAQYRHFVVDEYQDVNPLQQRLLDAWVGDRDNVCVVGDASQTIYSFTGASPEFLFGFRQRFPQASVVQLVRDYRSSPQVVGLANQLMRHASGPTARHRLALVAQRPDGPEVTFTEYPDETAEAEDVARRIRALLGVGVRASEIAVLFRTNGQSQAYEQALAAAEVSYLLRGAERFFARPEVRQAVLLLRGAARAGEERENGLADSVRAVLSGNGWTPEPPGFSGAVRERWESLAALIRLAEEFAAAQAGRVGLGEFVTELDERAAAAHVPTLEGVTLASLHAAKGLEWDAVFLVGLSEGLLPIAYAETTEAVEEERRLLYVGVTRARAHLALSWACARAPGGRASRRPSRFLDGLRPAGETRVGRSGREAGRGGAGAGRRSRSGPVSCRVCGRSLLEAVERKLGRCPDCPSTLDEALYERLREWRAGRAREAGLPAYCVFTDATLTAIAESRPTAEAELSAISGVGRAKLDKYAEEVLELCGAADGGGSALSGGVSGDSGGVSGDSGGVSGDSGGVSEDEG